MRKKKTKHTPKTEKRKSPDDRGGDTGVDDPHDHDHDHAPGEGHGHGRKKAKDASDAKAKAKASKGDDAGKHNERKAAPASGSTRSSSRKKK